MHHLNENNLCLAQVDEFAKWVEENRILDTPILVDLVEDVTATLKLAVYTDKMIKGIKDRLLTMHTYYYQITFINDLMCGVKGELLDSLYAGMKNDPKEEVREREQRAYNKYFKQQNAMRRC